MYRVTKEYGGGGELNSVKAFIRNDEHARYWFTCVRLVFLKILCDVKPVDVTMFSCDINLNHTSLTTEQFQY